MTGIFKNNAKESRFEYHIGAAFAYAAYRRKDGKLFIDKVEAPQELRGTGAASALMQHVVDFAKAERLQVVPVCSYAVAWMRRNSQPPAPKP